MFAKLKERLARSHLVTQVANMSAQDLSDLAVSRSQLMNQVRIPDEVLSRVAKMADVFGVDQNQLQRKRGSYLDAVEVCHNCAEVKRCRKTLAREGADRAMADDIDFCPNAERYARMASKTG